MQILTIIATVLTIVVSILVIVEFVNKQKKYHPRRPTSDG